MLAEENCDVENEPVFHSERCGPGKGSGSSPHALDTVWDGKQCGLEGASASSPKGKRKLAEPAVDSPFMSQSCCAAHWER